MSWSSDIHSQSGFTLIEVLIAIVLVSLLVGGIYAGMINGVSLNYAVAQRVAAFGLCNELLEQMRGAEYAGVTTANFPPETLFLTHLGGTQRTPLTCMRSCAITDLANPTRKAVTVDVAWNFRGRVFQESANGAIFYRDATAPIIGAVVGGEININPNNSPHNEFTLTLQDGSTVTRDDLTQDYPGYSGPATHVHVKPKGNGNQNGLIVNGQPFDVVNSNTYDIEADPMTVNLYNDNINGQGKAVGKWWIAITAMGATITVN